jgi:hypothetical protein
MATVTRNPNLIQYYWPSITDYVYGISPTGYLNVFLQPETTVETLVIVKFIDYIYRDRDMYGDST